MSDRLTTLLGCEFAIQLAPMGSVSVTASLPLAVADSGGHAVYPALALRAPALEPVLAALEGHASGVNFLVPLMNRETLELAVERSAYVDFFLADPDPLLVQLVHAAGGVCGWQVETAEEARAAESAGCDVVIVKASESGGRKRVNGPALLPLLDAVLDVIAVPVIAAGGIATARGVAAAHAAGADGVRVGTRFIAAAESEAHPDWIAAILEASADEAIVSLAFNAGVPEPGPHRVLRRSVEAAEALESDEAGVIRLAGAELTVPRFSPLPPTRSSTGAIGAMPFYAGESAGAVRRVQPAADIVAELARGLSAPS